MYIKPDYSYIHKTKWQLIKGNCGVLSVQSIHFDRYYTEKQKKCNQKTAEAMTDEQWSAHCDKVSRSFALPMEQILEHFKDRYDIHQISPETSTIEHFKSNWDLFFHSNRCWNGKDYMDCFDLTFNNNRSVSENIELLDEILTLVKAMEYESIYCRVQREAVLDTEKIKHKAEESFENLSGRFINYHGTIGKIKDVSEGKDNKKYGFFKKGARTKYHIVSDVEILTMHI